MSDNAAGSSSGAIYVYESSYVKVGDSTFSNNEATDNQIAVKNSVHIYADASLADSIVLYDSSNATHFSNGDNPVQVNQEKKEFISGL